MGIRQLETDAGGEDPKADASEIIGGDVVWFVQKSCFFWYLSFR